MITPQYKMFASEHGVRLESRSRTEPNDGAEVTGNEPADRRVRRTRRALREALVALIVERGYEKVTVQDVLDRADIGRSTFYAHYRDKDDLFGSCFDDLRAEHVLHGHFLVAFAFRFLPR